MTASAPAAPRAAVLDISHRAFRIHVAVFVVIIALLGFIDWYTAEPYWIHWVFLGWGAGVALHAFLAFRR
jgi:hypothetical protein